MILSAEEFDREQKVLKGWQTILALIRIFAETIDYEAEVVALLTAPLRDHIAEVAQDIAWYEDSVRGELITAQKIQDVGSLITGLRIHRGFSIQQLAHRLQVDPEVLDRAERSGWVQIDVATMQRVVEMLGGEVSLSITPTTPRIPRTETITEE